MRVRSVLLRKISMIGLVCGMFIFPGCSQKDISNEYVKLGNYKGIEISKGEPETISEERVENQLSMNAGFDQELYVDTKRKTVKDSDRIIIDLTEKINGEEITTQDMNVPVGSEHLAEGFREQVKGHSVGDTFEVDGIYTVTIKSIQEVNPSFQEEKARIREEMEKEAQEAWLQEQFQQIESYLLEHTEVIKKPEESQEVIDIILQAIAKKEKLELTDEKFTKKGYEYGGDDKEQDMGAGLNEKEQEIALQNEVVIEWLLKNAKEKK
ncbi:hypothetical protein [uncultured Robinsoniella sp.]|uniref:hypothetical protein n=1 Tax=uncultured Robinsoniella sp. TaxID=904190 RepID=UPI00374F220E